MINKKEIVINGVPAILNYQLDEDGKDKQLIHIGSDENITINWQELNFDKVVGCDDNSSFEFFIWDNQVIVDRFGKDYWYFDINDLESVIVDHANYQIIFDDGTYESYITNYFFLKFKDGEEHEFGGFDDEDDVTLFINCLRNINQNLLISEKNSFAINRIPGKNEINYKYSIENNAFRISLDNNELQEEILLSDINETKIDGNKVILIKNDNKIYEFRDVNDNIISKLNNN